MGSRQKSLLIAALLILWTCVQCTIRVPPGEKPAPNKQEISKSFFFKNIHVAGDQSMPRKVTPKTFLCGWAAEKETGFFAESQVLHNYNQAWGCNIEFEVTERLLIGRLVDPNNLDDREKWEQVIEIPIVSHYYVEPGKDANGRKTMETVHNSDRSDWSRRPYMTLDFSGLRVKKWSFALLDGEPPEVSHYSDIEWDKKAGFLGFTLHVQGAYGGSYSQAQFRFNFMEFESEGGNFQKTYFPKANARYLNPVFTIGQQAEDLTNVYFLAKWDLSKQTTIYLQNFPDQESERIAVEMLEAYNQELTKILKPGAREVTEYFKAVSLQTKHPFDLRRSSITWVDDIRTSAYSPLGVAFVNPDLRNGKVLWGGLTIWAGMLKRYVRDYSPSTLVNGYANSPRPLRFLKGDPALSQMPELKAIDFSKMPSMDLRELVVDEMPTMLTAGLQTLGLDLKSSADLFLSGRPPLLNASENSPLTGSQIEELRVQLKNFEGTAADLRRNIDDGLRSAGRMLESDLVAQSSLASASLTANPFPFETSSAALTKQFGQDHQLLTYEEKYAQLKRGFESQTISRYNGIAHDADRTFADEAEGWAMGLAAARAANPAFDSEKALRNLTKAILSHEFGHVLGLGHNFKGNYLPPESEMPAALYAKAKERATKGDVSTQSTSIMDYGHGRTEVLLEDEDTRPQAQDIQALSYIYGGKYPAALGTSDYVYEKLPDTWEIPDGNKFLRACDDLRASVGDDPFCARWDSGYDARSIVEGRFQNIDNGLVRTLFAVTPDRGGSPEMAEMYAWNRAITEYSRIRVFYEYMREQLMEKHPEFLDRLFDDQDSLVAFSDACADSRPADVKIPALLSDFFAKNPDMRELCQVNRMILERFQKIASMDGLDFTDKSFGENDQYVLWTRSSAVSGDGGHAFGTWRQLTVFPLKFAALLNMTTPTPYTTLGGWFFPIPKYTNEKFRTVMSTLYPKEFTRGMATVVSENLRLATEFGETTTHIGRTVLTMGSMLQGMMGSNDQLLLRPKYKDLLRRQTEFSFDPGRDVVAIIMDGKTREGGDPQRITHFDTKLYDFRAGELSERHMKNAYLLEDGKVIVQPPDNTFLMPLTDFQWASDKSGFVIALRIKSSDNVTDSLAKMSLRSTLHNFNKDLLDKCVVGEDGKQNGLQEFFIGKESNQKEFPGFEVRSRVASGDDDDHVIAFYNSLKEMFGYYEKSFADQNKPVDPRICQETLKGINLTASTALVTNGWWPPQLWDQFLKSSQ